MDKLLIALIILLIPGAFLLALIPIIQKFMENKVKLIRIGEKRTISRVVEWSDKTRTQPICFILKCPYCRKKQWARVEELYKGVNGYHNNYRCKHCNKAAEKFKLWSDRQNVPVVPAKPKFNPKTPGWKSVNNR